MIIRDRERETIKKETTKHVREIFYKEKQQNERRTMLKKKKTNLTMNSTDNDELVQSHNVDRGFDQLKFLYNLDRTKQKKRQDKLIDSFLNCLALSLLPLVDLLVVSMSSADIV